MLKIQQTKPHTTGVALSEDSVEIPYCVYGNSPDAVLLIHGWCCDQSIWGDQVAALASDYTVVTFDLASHGQAGGRARAWPMTAFVEDALAVMRTVDRPSWSLVGHSLGGVLAAKLGARVPDQINGIVVIDAIKRPDQRLPQADIEAMLEFLAADWMRNVKAWLPDAAYTDGTPKDVRSYVEDALQAADPTMAVESMRGFLAEDHAALLGAIPDVPLVLMNGAPQPPHPDFFAAFHPDCQLIDFDGAGHFVMLERPDQFNSALADTLQRFSANHAKKIASDRSFGNATE